MQEKEEKSTLVTSQSSHNVWMRKIFMMHQHAQQIIHTHLVRIRPSSILHSSSHFNLYSGCRH